MAISTDTDFLSLAHLTLKVNYKREFKTCSQQRSNTGALQTPLNTFLVSTFPLSLTPRTLILVEGSHVSTWNHLQPPRDDEGLQSGQWDAAEVYWGYLEKFCSPEKHIIPSFLIFPAWGLKYWFWNKEDINHIPWGWWSRKTEGIWGSDDTIKAPHLGLPISRLPVNGEKQACFGGWGRGHCHKQLNDTRRQRYALPRWLNLKDNRMSPVALKILSLLQLNLNDSPYFPNQNSYTKQHGKWRTAEN